MKAPEWDDGLLQERRDYLDDKDALAAFDYLVNAAIRLPNYACRPASQGVVKTFGYWQSDSRSRDFAFIVAKNHLTFYIRESGLAHVTGGFEGLKKEFPHAESKAGEWVVHLKTVLDASRLHSFLFDVERNHSDEQYVATNDAVENEIRRRSDIEEVEKEQLIKARRGQGRFRQDLEKLETCCRLTLVSDRQHLRASHIKPWCKSDDREKLDPNNGLLLSPHIDHLFDRGFISFTERGDLMLSPHLDLAILRAWGIDLPVKASSFSPAQCVYLEYHHRQVFLK